MTANFTSFNVLLLFAQFQCNYFFMGAIFCETKAVRNAKLLKSVYCKWKKKIIMELRCSASEFYSPKNNLVPFRRPFEAHFDGLMRIGDVVPASIRLPTFGNNLNESAAERRFSDVRDACAVGFDI